MRKKVIFHIDANYGIHTGEPVANAFRKCPNLVMEPPDHKI